MTLPLIMLFVSLSVFCWGFKWMIATDIVFVQIFFGAVTFGGFLFTVFALIGLGLGKPTFAILRIFGDSWIPYVVFGAVIGFFAVIFRSNPR